MRHILAALAFIVAAVAEAQAPEKQPKPVTDICRAVLVTAVRSPSSGQIIRARGDTAVVVLLCAPIVWWDTAFARKGGT